MSDSLSVETRSRSRSKTPFLRSQCDHENCTITDDGQHVHSEKKRVSTAPKVSKISEVIETVTKIQTAPVVPKTSDYSSEDDHSFEKRNHIQKSAIKVSSSTSTIVKRTSTHKSSSSQNNVVSLNEHLAETITSPIQPANVKEIRRLEAKIKTSTPIDHKKSSNRTMSADSSSSNDLNNSDSLHFAYQEYHEAGEFWNNTEKTDYTYSKLSPHRRHLQQGEIGMPNMSRRSLEQHRERINLMVARNPEQEEFIRRRYEQIDYARLRNNREQNLTYDSSDELDVVESEIRKRYTSNNHYMYNKYESESWITRFVSRVVTIFYNFVGIFIGSKDEEYLYSNRIPEQKGVISRIFSSITSVFVRILRSLYIGISSVLYYDTFLLKSSAPENRNKKRFLLLLLLLLPLLLLTAWNLMDAQEQTTYLSYYKSPISNLLPSLSLPLTLTQFLSKSPKLEDLTSSQSTKSGRMTSEEYDNLLNHINTYIQKQLEEKSLKEQEKIDLKVTKDLSLIISEKLKEQKLTSDIDIDKIVDAVYEKLSENPLKFHPENIVEIQHLVKTFTIPSETSTSSPSPSSTEIDSIVMRILNAPQLSQFIDNRIVITGEDHSQHHKTAIDGLTAEIELIKRILDEKMHENKELRELLDQLRLNQDGLSKRVDANEAFTKDELARMLILIDDKLMNLNEKQFAAINVQIKKSLGDIFGYKKDLEQLDLENWIKSLFVAKELLEERLVELSKNTDIKIKEEIERSGTILMEVISEKLKKEILLFIKEKEKSTGGTVTLNLGEDEIRRIVKSVLAIYDADKTGMVDYALESAGGQILSTRCTESYQTKTAQISVLGIPLWYPSNTPRIAISPNVQPGECWAFAGFPGYLVLRLNSFVQVTGFTMEHIPKSLAPTGRIDSAPRNFTVWFVFNNTNNILEHLTLHETPYWVYKSRMTRNRNSLGNTSSKTMESLCNTFQCRTRTSTGHTKSLNYESSRTTAIRLTHVYIGSGFTEKQRIFKNNHQLTIYTC